MVRALLDDKKTITRRLINFTRRTKSLLAAWMIPGVASDLACPFGVGDRLWVRENLVMLPDGSWHYQADKRPLTLRGGDERIPAMISWAHHKEGERCNSIHMPRWASRITLEVISVRVERLQDITEEDALAEGVEPTMHSETWLCIPRGTGGPYEVFSEPDAEEREGLEYVKHQPATVMSSAREVFRRLWEELNGQRAPWASNPWIWVLTFRVVP